MKNTRLFVFILESFLSSISLSKPVLQVSIISDGLSTKLEITFEFFETCSPAAKGRGFSRFSFQRTHPNLLLVSAKWQMPMANWDVGYSI